MRTTPAADWLLWLAAATIVIASFVAMTKDDLKARLAWSTIGQLAYCTAAALMAAGVSLLGGGLHMLTHAFGKITLFMCAGAILVGANVSRVSEMTGLGRRMPLVFVAFLVGSLSVIGLPPFGAFWSKFLLITSAFGSGHAYVAWAMIISSLLSVVYLAPIAVRALLPPEGDAPVLRQPKPLTSADLMVAPILIAAAGTVALFFIADAVTRYLVPVTGAAP
jgi:multicomponent Na+:H+ antiporter subunit D